MDNLWEKKDQVEKDLENNYEKVPSFRARLDPNFHSREPKEVCTGRARQQRSPCRPVRLMGQNVLLNGMIGLLKRVLCSLVFSARMSIGFIVNLSKMSVDSQKQWKRSPLQCVASYEASVYLYDKIEIFLKNISILPAIHICEAAQTKSPFSEFQCITF